MNGTPAAERVLAGLRTWEPPRNPRWSTCVDSLYAFIRENFPDDIVSRNISSNSEGPADILVKFPQGGHLAIEIKADLNDQSECYRLVGELFENVTRGHRQVVVLVCGSYDSRLLSRVRNVAAHLNKSLSAKVELIDKG